MIHPEPVHAQGMFGLAIAGIIVNGLAVLRLRNSAKLNEHVVFLHLLEDVLGWLAVLIVSIILFFIIIMHVFHKKRWRDTCLFFKYF